MTRTGIAVRTEILDEAATAFLARHPGARVVNLGAGLCTRFFRLDNGRLQWIDLDFPAVIELKQQLLPEQDRYRYLACSVLDDAWMDEIAGQPGRPMLLIAEGIFPYFTEDEVRKLLVALSRRFPGSEMLFEALSPVMVKFSARHPSVGQTAARFHWGLVTGASIESWNPGIRFLEEWYYFDRHPRRWRWLRFLSWLPLVRTLLKIVHVRLGTTPGASPAGL